MKKIIILTYLFAMLLASCTSEDEDNGLKEQQKVQITFAQPVMYGVTRAPVYGEISKYSTSENFLVYSKKYTRGAWKGWGSETNAFAADGEVVTYQASPINGWTTTTPYFFEPGMDYAFAAISPASEAAKISYVATKGAETNNGFQVTDFVTGALGQQVDLMYAPAIYGINENTKTKQVENTNTDYNGVNLKFKHTLSSIHFKVCIDPQFYKEYNTLYGSSSLEGGRYAIKEGDFVINSITVKNVNTKATFKQNQTVADDKNKTNTVGKETWESTSDNEKRTDYVFLNTNATLPLPTESETSIELAAKDITTLNGNYGLLIPQPTDKITVEVKWTYKWREKGSVESKTAQYTSTKTLESTPTWVMGKRYIYRIAFRGGSVIRFAPQVENWGGEEVHNI